VIDTKCQRAESQQREQEDEERRQDGLQRADEAAADVKDSYLYPPFVLYLIGLSVWMFLLVYWIRYGVNETLRRFSWGVSGGSITGLQNFLKDSLTIFKAVQADEKGSSFPWYLPLFVLCAAASAFGGRRKKRKAAAEEKDMFI
jgi:hypothetical protein